MIESDKTSRPAPLSTAYASAARSLGRRLRYLRGQLGVSQQELALKVGIHRTYISRLERGTVMPRLSTLVRLAMYLKIDVGKLVSEVNSPNPQPSNKRPQADVPEDAQP
jgi:transcriptional regulator with XRE-family HTH domain